MIVRLFAHNVSATPNQDILTILSQRIIPKAELGKFSINSLRRCKNPKVGCKSIGFEILLGCELNFLTNKISTFLTAIETRRSNRDTAYRPLENQGERITVERERKIR